MLLRLPVIAFALAVCLPFPAMSVAADKTPAKATPVKAADPSGTWTWTFTAPNGNTINSTAKLKLEGDKLTGTVTGRNGNEAPISEAKYAGGEVTFAVVREREGRTVTAKYKGKVSGDTIKGTIESSFGGETRTRDWDAKREPAPAAARPGK